MQDAQLKMLISFLEEEEIITDLREISPFHDDIKFHYYAAIVNGWFNNKPFKYYAGGSSLLNKKEALIKCLGESIERYCLGSYKNLKLSSIKCEEWPDELFPIQKFFPTIKKNKRIETVSGVDFATGKVVPIPLQLLSIGYLKKKNEISFRFPIISTGGAGGFDHESTLLRGIYEVIERDAIMTGYHNKIALPLISKHFLESKVLPGITSQFKRYNLELYVFMSTTDLQVPCYLTFIIDRSEGGPAVSVGAKASFSAKSGILGSIAEALVSRNMVRSDLARSNKFGRLAQFGLKHRNFDRSFYWWPKETISHLDFLLKGKSVCVPKSLKFPTAKDELEFVTQALQQRNYKVYYADISDKQFESIHYRVYKVIIPGLLPLYLNEVEREFMDQKRLEVVANWYGVEKQNNSVPHPFL